MSNLQDYVEVSERIKRFYEKYPKGSLQAYNAPHLEHVGERTFVVYCAAAYRTPDDLRPGIGYAWEPVPGPTPFTRDSELQNAETSAWGRAIVALGFETQNGIASKEEVAARQATEKAKSKEPPAPKPLSDAQRKKIFATLGELDREFPPPPPCADWKTHLITISGKDVMELNRDQASSIIEAMQARLERLYAEREAELAESEQERSQQDAAAETPEGDIPF